MIYEKEGMNNIKLGSLVKIDHRGWQGDGSFRDSILYIVGKLYPRSQLCMCIPITRFPGAGAADQFYYASNLVLVSSGLLDHHHV
jgi:hypothetical protein